jgi:hypothetical protein
MTVRGAAPVVALPMKVEAGARERPGLVCLRQPDFRIAR